MGALLDFGVLGRVSAGFLAWTLVVLAAISSGLILAFRRQVRRRAASSELAPLLDSIRAGLPPGVLLVVLDPVGRIQFASQKAITALGLPPSESRRGRMFTGLSCWDEPAESRHALARAILAAQTGKPRQLPLSFVCGRSRITLLFDLQAQISAKGDARHLVISAVELESLSGAPLSPAGHAAPSGLADGRRAAGAPNVLRPLSDSRERTPTQMRPDAESDALLDRGTPPDHAAASKKLMDSMLKLLPTSKSLDEALKIVASYLGRLFPGTSGSLFMQKKGASGLHRLRSWGGGGATVTRIGADDCWALRHSELHWVEQSEDDLHCSHHPSGNSACLPLIVRGEMVGVLTMAWRETAPDRALLESIADPLASALAQTTINFELREQATKDPLTGLLNRQVLELEFERLLQRSREDAEPASVLMMDIDHFKQFNDRFGHDAGDLVLKNVAARIVQAIRASDLAFRFGGEELMVLLPCCGTDEAIVSAQRIQKGLTELTLVNRGERLPPVTVSIGVATFPNDGLTPETLFQAADAAVYAAKAAGRNAVVHQSAVASAHAA